MLFLPSLLSAPAFLPDTFSPLPPLPFSPRFLSAPEVAENRRNNLEKAIVTLDTQYLAGANNFLAGTLQTRALKCRRLTRPTLLSALTASTAPYFF